jgi:hypothetical protein
MIQLRQALATPIRRRPGARRSLLLGSALVAAVLLAPAALVLATPGGDTEIGRLHSALARMAKLTSHRLLPPASRLAGDLPADADRLDRLREPASTAETQVGIALGELQQMSALTYDPHYLPALVAAGRAFVAISGQDPLTRTAINPEYLGLEHELAADTSRLQTSGRDAAAALRGIRRLNRELIRSKRRAGQLERKLRRMRARGVAAGSEPR